MDLQTNPQDAAAPAVTSLALGARLPRPAHAGAGTAPGIEIHELATGTRESFHLTCTDFSPDQIAVQELSDEDAANEFLARHRPEWSVVRWIDVRGLENSGIIRALAEKYALHPLAIEDVLTPQRAKADEYPPAGEHLGRLFIIAETIQRLDERLESSQLALFLGQRTLLSFQAGPGDTFAAVRRRLGSPASRVRRNDASFLAYSLIDSVVDSVFPVLEDLSDRLEPLEEEILDDPSREVLQRVHRIKREVMLVRRVVWPLRDLVHSLQSNSEECFSEIAQTYLRDVYDHVTRAAEFVEIYRDLASELADTYVSAVSHRMNEVMRTLTIIATIFVPLTFVAGVYGMNMPIPENDSPVSYPVFWAFSLLVAGGMLLWFRRRRWF